LLFGIPVLPEGTILLLRFTLPSLKMVVAAVVVHTTPGDAMGLTFLDLMPVHRVVIQELMNPEVLALAPGPLEPTEAAQQTDLRERPGDGTRDTDQAATAGVTSAPPVASEAPASGASGPEPNAARSNDSAAPYRWGGPENRSRRVLVVDDHDRTRTMLRGMIEGKNKKFVVTEARDGEECIQIARDQPPFDLIFLDVDMPRLDGLGACRQLRALGVSSPIIFLTGRNELDDFRAGREAGADTYIKKPILLGTLRSMLGLFTSGSMQRR
jgi:CheY-like chemotaxis protein